MALDSREPVEGVVAVKEVANAEWVVTVVVLDSMAGDLKARSDLQGRTVNKPEEDMGHTGGLAQHHMGLHLQ